MGLTRRLPSRLGVLGLNRRNLECIYTNNRRSAYPNVDDKLKCKGILFEAGVPVPDTVHVVDGHRTLRGWAGAVEDLESFVIKPNHSFGGRGIALVTRVDGAFQVSGELVTVEVLTNYIRRIINGAFSANNLDDEVYIEERVSNSPGMQSFLSDSADGVADVRLIYLEDQPIMAMIRVPTEASDGKANLHQGGLGIGIDLETGLTLSGCHKDRVVTHHPETNELLSGRPVADFALMMEIGARISTLVGLGYIGVDFVHDAIKGVLVLEVNARPGLAIQIANLTGLGRRLGL